MLADIMEDFNRPSVFLPLSLIMLKLHTLLLLHHGNLELHAVLIILHLQGIEQVQVGKDDTT